MMRSTAPFPPPSSPLLCRTPAATKRRCSRALQRLLLAAVAIGLTLLLLGCGTVEKAGQAAHESIHSGELGRIRKLVGAPAEDPMDPALLRDRWRGLLQLADRKAVEFHATQGYFVGAHRWVTPGLILEYRRVDLHSSTDRASKWGYYWYDPETNRVKTNLEKLYVYSEDLWVTFEGETGFSVGSRSGEATTTTVLTNEGYWYRRLGAFTQGRFVGTLHSEESLQRFVTEWQQKQYADRKRRDEAYARFLNALSFGFQTFTQAYSEQRTSQTSQVSTSSGKSASDARPSAISASAAPQRPQQVSIAPGVATSVGQKSPPKTSLTSQAGRESRVVPSPNRSESNSTMRASKEAAESTRAQEAKLGAFPEAIVACTRPDSKGAFRCATPVTHLNGGPGDKDWQTPEAAVATMDSCPNARKLPSTTHLVWGCGYGATNNTNTLDRSAGVDVQGRSTFYCSAQQTSCRRTTP